MGKRWNTEDIVIENNIIQAFFENTNELTPITKTNAGEFTNTNVTDVSYGKDYMAIISNGKLYTCGNGTWGDNITCVVADGKIYKFGGARFGLDIPLDTNEKYFTPHEISFNSKNITQISIGSHHFAIIDSNQLYTFGFSKNGQLGFDDKNGYVDEPTLVPKFMGMNVTRVSCGINYTMVIANNKLYILGEFTFKDEIMQKYKDNVIYCSASIDYPKFMAIVTC